MIRLMLSIAALLALPSIIVAQNITTYGDCSPVIQQTAGNVTVVCYRDSDQKPKFRVVYYRLGGVGQSFLLNGKLSPDWEKYLGGQQAIVNNAVHKEIRLLTDRFGEQIWGSYLYGNVGFEGGEFGMELGEYAQQVNPNIEVQHGDGGATPRLDQVDGWRVFAQDFLFVPDLDAAEALFVKGAFPAGYNAYWGGAVGPSKWVERGISMTAPTLWRSLTQDDLDGYEARYDAYFGRALDVAQSVRDAEGLKTRASRGEFPNTGAGFYSGASINHRGLDALRYLAREGLPENYGMVIGGPGVHYGWSFSTATRSADLLVAVLENVGDQPMDVGAFTIAETEAMTLREHHETQSLLAAALPEDRRLWPPGILSPGEKLVIPIRIEMPLYSGFFDRRLSQYREYFEAGEQVRNEAMTGAAKEIIFTHYSDFRTPLFALGVDQLPAGRIPEFIERFEYGPAWSIQAVEIDGVTYDFRQHDPNNFILFAGGGVGSCPYIYTHQSDGDIWIEENHFLLGATAPEKKRTERLRLRHFEGRLEIREKEHELAHLDRIALVLRDADGEETVHPAVWPKALAEIDGDELILGYGERVEVTFEVEDGAWEGKTAFIAATGFYVPFSDPTLFARRN